VPLLVALLGPGAAGPLICTLLADMLFTSSLCIALSQLQGAQGAGHQGAGAAALRALRGALSNPLPWSIALGAVLSVSGVRLPGPVDMAVRMLAESATPVALFTIGAVLWRAGQHIHTRTPLAHYLPVALIKLFVHPLLVGAVGLAARAAGVNVPSFGLAMLVLAAALPSASGVSLLAERHGADNGRVARIIMASTVLAFGSFTLIAWSFGGHIG
jgi:malonate transporter and related proteins